MSEHTGSLPWTEEQWAAMQQLVQDAARRARVASSFLPLHGPLPPGESTVPALSMTQPHTGAPLQRGEVDFRLDIDDGQTFRLTTIACDVYLKTQQAEDPELVAAHDLLARAADIVGRLEDAIVFNGQPAPNMAPRRAGGAPVVQPEIYTVSHGNANHPGLLTQHPNPQIAPDLTKLLVAPPNDLGNTLVASVGDAIQTLESYGHYGPFACVLGHVLYQAAVRPNAGSLVMPLDRITPLLNGPLLRSGVVPPEQGVVVALAGAPVDLVVASDVHVGFLQRSLEPRYVLRVSERFVLRLKQPEAVCQLRLPAAANNPAPPAKKAAAPAKQQTARRVTKAAKK